jgi:hypothetical protein
MDGPVEGIAEGTAVGADKFHVGAMSQGQGEGPGEGAVEGEGLLDAPGIGEDSGAVEAPGVGIAGAGAPQDVSAKVSRAVKAARATGRDNKMN